MACSLFSIVGQAYQHLLRTSEIAKNILVKNEISFDCIVLFKCCGICTSPTWITTARTTRTCTGMLKSMQKFETNSNYAIHVFSRNNTRKRHDKPKKWYDDAKHKNRLPMMILKNFHNNGNQQQWRENAYTHA